MPGGTPGAVARVPDTPGWDADTHPGQAAGPAGRAGWRPQPLQGEAGWTLPHAPCSLHRYASRAYPGHAVRLAWPLQRQVYRVRTSGIPARTARLRLLVTGPADCAEDGTADCAEDGTADCAEDRPLSPGLDCRGWLSDGLSRWLSGGLWSWLWSRRDRGVGPDVDPPAGEPGGQPGVLPLFADRQRKLVIGHDDLRLPGRGVHHVDPVHPGRRQRVGHEAGRVVGVVHDVDLLAVQFVHHVPHPAAHGADAGTLSVDALLMGPDRDLGAVPGLAGDRDDLHRAGRRSLAPPARTAS